MSQHQDPELTDLENALAALTPQTAGLSPEKILFEAGRASVPRGWGWRATAMLSLVGVAVLGGLLWLRPTPEGKERIVYINVKEPVPSPPVPPPESLPPTPEPAPSVATFLSPVKPSSEYLRHRYEVLRWGVDVLPSPAPRTSRGQLLTPRLLHDSPDNPFDALKQSDNKTSRTGDSL